MIKDWHQSQQQLKFQLSDLTLGSRSIPVLACEMGPDSKPGEISIPPDQPLENGMQGFVMRGVPVASQRPLFETRGNYLVYTPHHYRRYYLDLGQTFDEYTASFRAKTRATIRRKVRRFATHSGGEIDFRVYRTPEEFRDFYTASREVSAATYQERLLDAGLPDNPAYREQLQEAAANDAVRGYMLFHQEQPVSYLLLSVVDDILVYDYLGFDPAFGKWSIGTVLHWLALESILDEQRFRMLDFTEGEGEQKRRFSSGNIVSANIYCLKKTPATQLWLRMHALTNGVSRAAGNALERFGLRSRLKSLLRRKA